MYQSNVVLCFLCVTLLMLKCTQSYVLLAANIEDFKKLAKKFVPEKLAIQIAEMAATSATNYRQETPQRGRDDGQYDKDIEQDITDVSAEQDDSKDTLPLKVEETKLNFEDLVQKVKQRIEEDMLNRQKLISTVGDRGPERYSVADKNVDEKYEDDRPDVRNTNQHFETKQQHNNKNQREIPIEQSHPVGLKESIQNDNVDAKYIKEEPDNADEAETEKLKQTFVNQQPDRYAKVKQNKEKLKHNTELTTLDNDYEYEDETAVSKLNVRKPENSPPQEDKDADLPYAKVSMIKNDSYEDYVTPERERDIYASRESRTRKDRVVIAKKNTETTKMKVVAFAGDDAYGNDGYNDNLEELKAKTEDLQYDDSVYNNTGRQHQTERDELSTPMSKAKYVKGTNIPRRDVAYKMSSPNYYAKIPVVAEKYDFDEPIPEKDREPENLKPIPTLPSVINGKVKLNL